MKRIVILVISALALVLPAIAQATTPAPVKRSGVTVSPAFQELTIQAVDYVKPSNFTVTNNDSSTASFTLSAIDMGALDDTGGLIFSGLPADYQKKYGLAKWVQLEQTDITIAGHSTFTVQFRISNDDSLAPGGHYGAIVMTPKAKGASNKNQIALSPQPTSLLFVKKIGGELYKLTLQDIKTSNGFWHLPNEVKLNFKNTGNVHVVPRGLLVVKDPFGKETARGIVNEASSLVLPERSRNFIVSIKDMNRPLWPGRYRLLVGFRYDGQAKTREVSLYFTWLNLPLLFGLVVLMSMAGYGGYRLRPILNRKRHKKP
ncbi:MAG TPA: hypothetical protein VLG37_03595 [Candidatus Saccharimonadales bacterium]|nr:hypothetical protein [Candidatus Saccharimonadales bacterium]